MFSLTTRPPEVIIAVCFVMLAMSLFGMYSLSQVDLSQLSAVQISLSVASMAATLLSILGIWSMRRWGVYLFVVVFLASQFNLIMQQQWVVGSVFIPGLILLICSVNLKRMS